MPFGLDWWKLGLLLAIGLSVWFFFEQQEDMREALQQKEKELAQSEQKRRSLSSSFTEFKDQTKETLAQQRQQMKELSGSYQSIREKTQRIDDVLSQHDLTNLAFEKPGLIQNRVNKGTGEVFRELEETTTTFAKGDDSNDGE